MRKPRIATFSETLLTGMLIGIFAAPPQLVASGPALRLELLPGPGAVQVRLTNTSQSKDYQILRKTNLNATGWEIDQQVPGANGQTVTTLPSPRPPTVFYSAREVPAATNTGLNLALSTTGLRYPLGSPPLPLDRGATAQNLAHPTFAGGQLTLSFSANGDPDDRIAVAHQGNQPGQIGVTGNVISAGGIPIGTVSGGAGLTPLQILFNASATAARVTDLLRAITFVNRSLRYSRLPRTIQYDLTDGQGGRGGPAFLTVNVDCPGSIDVVVVFDVSFSLPEPAFLQMKQTATNLMSYLDPARDRVGLVTFYGGSEIVDPLTNDFGRVREDLLALSQRNGTVLHPGISNAQQLLLATPSPDVLRMMLILTDGEMNPYTEETNALLAASSAKASNVRIVAAGFVNDRGYIFNEFLSQIASSAEDYYAPNTASNAPPLEVQLAGQLRAAARSFCRQPNQPPTAIAQSLVTAVDTPIAVTLTGSDPDGDALTSTVISGPAHGTLIGTPPSFIYAPAPGYVGPDRFEFRVADGLVQSVPAAVSIDVRAVNQPCPLLDAPDWTVGIAPPRLGVGAAAVPGSVQWNGCELTLTEGDSFVVEARRSLAFPAFPNPTERLLLALTYESPEFDRTATHRIHDAFEAALVDRNGRTLTFNVQGPDGIVPAGAGAPADLPAFPDAYFNHSDSAPPFAAPLAEQRPIAGNLQTLVVDVTALATTSDARLVLRLVNNDQDRATRVRVTDLRFESVPAGPDSPGSPSPAFSLIAGPGASAVSNPGAICAGNVTFGVVGGAPSGSSSNVVSGPGLAPTLTVFAPASRAALPPGPVLINGVATVQSVTNTPTPPSLNRLAAVQINGQPVGALDAQGNFFAVVDLHPGTNVLQVVAHDSGDRRTTNRVTLIGSPCAANLAGLGVVTASVQPVYGRTTFNEGSTTLYADVSMRNDGSYAIGAPLYVGVSKISDPRVRALGADAVSSEGIPFYDFSSALPAGTLASGQSSLARTLAFANPDRVQFTYELVILGQLNQQPAFVSVPPIETRVGRPYTYASRAEDPDGDVLSYALVEGPAGAAIHPASGMLSWPTAGPAGGYSFAIEASDGRGGRALQRFVLSVVPATSNRPPVFVSTPVVVAYLGSNYQYAAQATDLDGDTLVYGSAGGPTNLTVQSGTGLVSWVPSVDQLGTNFVNLTASDGRGGLAQQPYVVVVRPDPSNRPPIIFSQPIPFFEFPPLGAGSQGLVQPEFLDLFLADGDAYAGTAAITLPATNVLGGTADIAFVVDQSGSMAGEQAWIGDMLQGLDTALVARGIGPNRYALIGFPGASGPDYTQTFPILGGSWTASLYGPDNVLVGSRRFDGAPNPAEIVLPADGSYRLVIAGDGNTNAVSYGLSYRVLTNATIPITLGQSVAGVVAVPGQENEYSFTLSQRTLATFDSLTASSTLTWSLSGPGGSIVNARRFDLSDSTDQALPTLDLPAGSYLLTVDGTTTAIGAYAFRLLNLAQATPLTPGIPVDGELNPPNQTDLFGFSAGAGQRVFVDLRSLGGPATSSRWRLLGPAGQVVAVQTLGTDLETGPLLAGGAHTLLVEGRVTETNNRPYSLNVEVLGSPAAQPIVAGQVVSGQITAAGQQQVYTFDVSQRAFWYFDALSSNQANNLTWTLTGPAGTNVNLRRFDQSDAGDITSPALDLVPGAYRLTIDGTGDIVSAFAFRLLNLDLAQRVTVGSALRGELDPANETDLYQFAAAPGDRVIFDAISRTNLPNARWRLLSPAGSVAFNTLLNLDVAAVTLSQLGDYRLLIEGSRLDAGLGAGTYEVRLIPTNSVPVPPLLGSPLVLGEQTRDQLSAVGQTNAYLFTLTNRSLLYLDALTNRSTIVWGLRGPLGAVVTGRRLDQTDSADQAAPVLDLVAGDYQLSFSATTTNLGGYAFALLDLAAAQPLTPGIPLDGPFNLPNQTVAYRFAANPAQRLYADMQSLSGGATSSRWRLIDPLGQQSFNQLLTTDVETGPLTISGTYTLLLEGRISETNSRSYTLNLELLTDALQPLVVGQTVAGTIRVAGEEDTYAFNLPDRTLLYFDSLTPSNTLTWSLDGPAGVVVNGRSFAANDTANPLFTLDLIPGDYRLTVDATADNRLAYGFLLQAFHPLDPAAEVRLLSGFMDTGRGAMAYALNGVQGEKLYLDFDPRGGASFGPASLFVGTSRLLVTSAGGTEDGYAGIAAALRQLPFRSSAALNVILVTDENRDIVDSNLTLASTIAEAQTNNVRMNVILDGLVQDNAGQPAIGLDAALQAYTADGAGGFTVSTNGAFLGAAVSDDAPENPLAEYVPLAWQTGGATWDLNQLRLGGNTAVSFTKAFVEVNAERIEEQLRLMLVLSDPSVLFTNFTGILDGISSGDTATFSFRLVRTGDARSFALQFIRPGTTDVLASIPVRVRNEYVYPLAGYDPDGDQLRYTLVRGPAGASLDPNSGLLRWRPQTNDASTVLVRVEDGRGGVGFQEFTVAAAGTNRPPQLEPIGYAQGATDRLYTFRLDASDPDGDRLAFELIDGPSGLAVDAATGVVLWRPSPAQLGVHAASVRVRDGRGGVAEQSWNIEINPRVDNANPVFGSTPVATARVGRPYLYRALATDPNADPLTFDLSLGPPGLSVSTNGLVLWVPAAHQTGSRDVILRVQDPFGGVALQAYSIHVSAENTAPVFVSVPGEQAVVGAPYRYEVIAQDAEGQSVTFAFAAPPPAGATLALHPFRANAAVLDWTPGATQSGVSSFELIANDPDGAPARQTFTVTVTPAGLNTPPSFVSRPRTTARVSLPYVSTIEATDPDADPLAFAVLRAPAGLTLTNSPTGSLRSRLLVWTPSSLGTYPIALSVNDGRPGGVVTQEFVLTVVSTMTNAAPVIASIPASQATVQQLYAYDLQAVDPEGDAVSWRLAEGPAGMSLDAALGTLRWTPQVEQLGSVAVTIEATDLYQASAVQSFAISVELANRPPRLTSTPPTTAQTGEPLFYAAAASDPDGDRLRWSLTAAPAGMIIDAATGLVRWTPSTNQLGNHVVTLNVSDGRGGTAAQTFNIFASNLRANHAPVIVSSPLRNATVGRPYNYTFQATDTDGDTLTVISTAALPAGATFTPGAAGAGVLSWIPGGGQVGRHDFALEARDPAGASASQRFSVVVRSNAVPAIASSAPTNAVPLLPYRYDVRAVDADGDALAFSVINGPSGLAIDEFGRVTWLPTRAQAGLHPVALNVNDSFGGAAVQSFAIRVAADTQPPTVRLNIAYNLADSGGAPYVRAGSAIPVRVEATDDVEVTARELTIAGVALSVGPDGSALVPFPATGTFPAVARAMDSSGNTASVTNLISVVDPGATSTVAIVIHSPTNSAEIRGPTHVVATLTSREVALAEYVVELAEWNLDEVGLETALSDPRLQYTVLTNVALPPGTYGLTNARVARFDPTLLLNGAYLVRVTAIDANRQSRREGVLLNVTGDLKFGEFRLEFTDLRIPLAGIPITLKRVYDSRTSRQSGDFGFGWTLGVQDAGILEIGKSRFYGLGGEDTTFTSQTRIYMNTPDGRRVGFGFAPEIGAVALVFGAFYRPMFKADPGVEDRLEPLEAPAAYQYNGAGQFVGGFGLVGYNPSAYRLITRDNFTYLYDQRLGLRSVRDLNGNRLEYTPHGIFHYLAGTTNSDQSVRFVRDSLGRITEVIDPDGRTLRYTYDAAGDLRAFADPMTNVTRYGYHSARAHFLTNIVDPLGRDALRLDYDTQGRLLGVTDPLGQRIAQEFDLDAKTGAITDPNGITTVSTYDDSGNEIQRVVEGISTNRFEYDANQRLTRSVDARGFVTHRTYDQRGNITNIVDALGHTTSVRYNDKNKPVQVTDAAGAVTYFDVNDRGQMTNVVNALGGRARFNRDALGRVRTITDFNGYTTTYDYEGGCPCGRPTRILHPDGTTRAYEYGALGRTLQETDELGRTRLYAYDAVGRITETREPDGGITRSSYNAAQKVSETDPLGRTTFFGYDAADRLIAITNALGGVTRFEYGLGTNRTAVIDPSGNITRYRYDRGNRLTQQIDPWGRTNSFAYDALGNMIETVDRNGRRRTFDYDGLNRRTTEIWWEGLLAVRTQSYAFNAVGALISAEDPAGRMAFDYDLLNRLTRAAQGPSAGLADFALSYAYDAMDNEVSATDHSGVQVAAQFDPRSRMTRRIWQGGGIPGSSVRFDSDAVGNRTNLVRYADVAGAQSIGQSRYAYNAANALTDIAHVNGTGDTLAVYRYQRDSAQQISERLLNGQVTRYGYDSSGQLTNALYSSGQSNESYRYDANGNRVGGTIVVTTNNQITADGVYVYAYDGEGNLVSRRNRLTEASTTYRYDHRNRLITVVDADGGGNPLQTVEFTYDILNRRVAKSINGLVSRFLFNRDQVWADTDAAGLIRARYFVGSRLDEMLARYWPGRGVDWYLTDNLGTVRDVASAAGAVVNHIDYDSFGRVLSQSAPVLGDRFLFTGREFESAIGFYFCRARYYDPSLGRFISNDPIGFATGDFNLYRYVGNNPIRASDPTGLGPSIEYAMLIGAITGALLAPTFDIICKLSLGQGGDISVSREIKKSVVGAILGAIVAAILFYVAVELMLATLFAEGAVSEFIFYRALGIFAKSQQLIKVPTVGLTFLGTKIFLFQNCDFVEVAAGGF